jgi:hypothetical protein
MFRHGNRAVVILNGVDISSYLTSADLVAKVNTVERTMLSRRRWTEVIPGEGDASFDIAGLYDPAVVDSPVLTIPALMGSSSVPVEYYPGGNDVGQVKRSFSAVVTAFTESSPVGGLVAFTATLAVSGEVSTSVLAA